MRSSWVLWAVCFVVLPCLPALVLALLDPGSVPIFRDRIVVVVLVAIAAALASAALARRTGRRIRVTGLYGAATGLLTLGPIVVVIWIWLEEACGGRTDGSC